MESEVGIRLILVIGSSAMLLMATFVVFFVFMYQRKLLRKQMEYARVEELLRKEELSNAYKVLEAKDIERQNVARELHDNVGSILTSLNIYLDTLGDENDKSKFDQKLARSQQIGREATDEIRKLSHRLASVSLQHFGLETAVKDLIQTVTANNSIKFDFSLSLVDELEYQTSLNLYRILQELVNNTLKYAKASRINLQIHTINSEYLSFIYEDNGTGFDVSNSTKGMGLLNIRSRIESMNGDLTIDSTHRGSSFIIEIPIRK